MAPAPPPLLIFVGLYQEELVRFRVAPDEELPNRFRLQQLQSDHIQRGAINVLRSHGPVVASGGADGRVVVLDVAKGSSWDVTMPNEETVNGLEWSACGRFLFVGGAERSVFYVDVGKRVVSCRKWNVHRTGVAAVRVRPPTGRVMLTVGQDRMARVWDLYLGRTTVTDEFRVDGRFAGPISCVEFSPDGELLVAAGEGFARVNLIRDGRIVRVVTFEGEKPVAILWLSESVLLIGMSSGRGATLRIDDEGEPRWTRFYRDGKLTAMARAGNYLATTSNRTVLTLWEILEGFRFWPLCHAEITGKATSLIVMDAAQLGLMEFAAEKEKVKSGAAKDSSNEESSSSELWNNSFGDTPSEDGETDQTMEEEAAHPNSPNESEEYQIIPETPPQQQASLQSLIDSPAEPPTHHRSDSESSLESLRVSDEQSDSGSFESVSDEQVIVVMSCLDGLDARGEFNADYDGDNDDSDVSDPSLIGSGGRLCEGTTQC